MVTLAAGTTCDIGIAQIGGPRPGGTSNCGEAYGVSNDSTACGTQLTYSVKVDGVHVQTVALGCAGC